MKFNFKYFTFIAIILLAAITAKAQDVNPLQDGDNNQSTSIQYNVTNNLEGRNRKDYLVYDYNRLEDAKLRSLQLSEVTMMYNIGSMYRDGANVKRNYIQAKEWFTKAVQLGHPESMVELAKILSYSKKYTGVNQDLEKSEELLNKAIATDKGEVYYKIGQMYERGVFFTKDLKQALVLYQQSAKKNYDKAYVKLYLAYQFGIGTPKNQAQAINWLRVIQKLAKDQNVKDYATYILSEKYYDMAVKLPVNKVSGKYLLFSLSWDNGKSEAADMIAECHAKGYGVKRDCDKAKAWYEMSIKEFESVTAMEQLGNMLVNADCGNYKRDYATAAQLFRKAAELGGSYGAYMMGYMYQNGMGVEKNNSESAVWYDRSNKLKARPRLNKIKRRKFTEGENIAN